MSATAVSKQVRDLLRWTLVASGVLSAIVGLLILVMPLKTAAVGTALIALYTIIAGVVYIGLAFTALQSVWARVGHILLGVVFLVAGVVALFNLGDTTLFIATFVGVFVGVAWIIDGIVSLTTLAEAKGSKGWTIFYAITSVIAGIVLLFSPLYIALLWIFLGAFLLVLGIAQIIRAFRIGKEIDEALAEDILS